MMIITRKFLRQKRRVLACGQANLLHRLHMPNGRETPNIEVTPPPPLRDALAPPMRAQGAHQQSPLRDDAPHVS
jgi:hypothetical protein